MARLSDVRIDGRAVARLLGSEQGPVMRHTAQVAQQVKALARRQVGVSDPTTRFTSRGGGQHLRDSIVTRFVRDRKGPAVWVGSELDHARLHHEGTEPHTIVPRRAKALRFQGPGGQVVFAVRVNHPGTRPNRYLTDSARQLGLNVSRLA